MKKNWIGKMVENNLILPPRYGGGMSLRDSVRVPDGHLRLVVKKVKTDEIVQVEEGKNIVTNGGRQALSHLFAGDAVSSWEIADMEFGDGTGTPAITDTGLFGATIISKAVTYNFPVVSPMTQVQFVATVGQFEGNGSGSQIYQEAALLCGNSTFATHKAFGLITKTSDLVIMATWTFTF